MRILVLGAGGVGGYFGGRLAEAGANVTFLVRNARKDVLARDGLRIVSPLGSSKVNAIAVTQEELGGHFDVVLLTCKSYDLDSAIDAIRPAVGPNTAVLPLLNGMEHIERLNDEFGAHRVLGGVAMISAIIDEDGSILHRSDQASIIFGEQNGEMSERVRTLHSLFPETSVTAEAVPNIIYRMWRKVVPLSTAAGMACLMRTSVLEISQVPGGSQLVLQLLAVNAEIAAREGYPLADTDLEDSRTFLANPPYRFIPSMLHDIEQGKRVEGDHITGFMLRKALQHRLDSTLHVIIDVHLKAYEQRRAMGKQ